MGAGHAAAALAELLDRLVLVDISQVRVQEPRAGRSERSRGAASRDPVATVAMPVMGDVTGRLHEVFPGGTCARLAGLLTGGGIVAFPEGFGELEQSALKEAANIVATAYARAITEFTGVLLILGSPAIRISPAALAGAAGEVGNDDAPSVLVETGIRVFAEDQPVGASFVLAPDAPSVAALLRAIGTP